MALAACLHGGPTSVTPNATLGPNEGGAGARAKAAFAVVFAGPRGTVSDRKQPAVTVLFNRTMREPDAPETSNVPAVRIATEEGAAVPGSWRWIGTHGLLFAPDAALPGATRFVVVVPAGTRAVDGSALATDYRFDFITERPRVKKSDPADLATDLRPQSTFRLEFNQPMAPAEVEKSVRLIVRASASDKGRTVAVKATHPSGAKNKNPSDVVVLTPQEKLPLDSDIELKIDKGLRGEGPLGTREARSLRMRTYGPIRLADVRCPKVNLVRCQAHRDWTVILSNAVSPEEWRAHLKVPGLPIRPITNAERDAASKRPPGPGREHLVRADPDYGKRYHVVVTAGLRDVFGQKLAKDIAFDVDTEAPFTVAGKRFDPKSVVTGSALATNVAEADPGDTGETGESVRAADEARLRAEAADPRPKRPMLSYAVDLGLRGHVVEALAKQGIKGHKIPIGALNVPTYGMSASKMREQDAIAWLTRGRGGPGEHEFRWDWVRTDAAENVRSVRNIDLDALLGGPSARGAALVAVTVPGSPEGMRSELVTVTDLAVSAEMSRYGSTVWVTKLSTGQPVANATVAIQKRGKPELFSTKTDAQGLAFIPSESWNPVRDGAIDQESFVVVRAGDDWTYQRVQRGQASYRDGGDVDLAQRGEWAGIVYTDRGVYRPGEAAKLAGIFRQVDAAGIRIKPDETVRLYVDDGEGERVFDGRVKLDAYGAFALDVPLPKTSHLGNARVVAQLGRGNHDEGESFDAEVLLAAYKASEFKVSVDADKKEYVRGDNARFDVAAEYLFGAPMGEAPSHQQVTRRMTTFTPPRSDGFVVNDESNVLDYTDTNPRAEDLSVKAADLDGDGRTTTSLKLDLPRMRSPENVTFEAEVQDLTNQTVAKSTTVLVHPASFYLGVKRPSKRFVAVGAPVRADLVAFDITGAHVPGAQAKVELVQRTWVGVTQDEEAQVPVQRSRVKDEVVGTCTVTTSAQVEGCSIAVGKPGFYILRARSKDARGNEVGSSTSFYAIDDRADEPAARVAWADPQSRKLKLEVDKPQYKAGDTARVLVRNPFKEAQALVSVERAGVLWKSVVPLKGPMPVVEVPIKAEYFPNAFISVHLVRGRASAPPERGADVGAPDFRIGTAPIEVDPDTHRLKATITTSKKEYRPGEEVDADVLVVGPDKRGAKAAVTFYAVDEGVLMLTGYDTPDPLPAFARERKLAVFSLDSREDLARIVPLKNGERVKILGYEYPSTGDDKGGYGGGGGEGAIRADFKTTAFFEAGKVTSAEGRAHYRFKLPDNLTTFRLMAVVAGADDRFGTGDAKITTYRRLMARPAMPRVVRAGDQFDAGVIISSKDLPNAVTDVTIKATGVQVVGQASRRVEVPKGGSVEVRFPVKATAPGEASFEFAVAGGGEKDRVLVKRAIELPLTVQSVSSYGETDKAAAVKLGDLKNVRTDQGGLEVHVASTALVGLSSTFEKTIDYPYGCTEQLTSRTLPLLVLSDMAKAFDFRMPAKVDAKVDEAVGDLLHHQQGSGAFGYWEDDEASDWLSAYAMLALESAAKKGYFVPKSARDRGISYLRDVLSSTKLDPSDAEDDEEPRGAGARSERGDRDARDERDDDAPVLPEERRSPKEKRALDYATAAFVADVLATVGQPDPGYLNRLFDARAHQPLFTQALILHAMAVAHMPRAELDALSKEIEGRLRKDASRAFADEVVSGYETMLDSSSRTTALVLRGLVAANPKHPVASLLARGLLAQREGGAWRSTQENVWALMALDDYRRAQETAVPDFDAKVFLGGDRIGEVGFHGRSASDQMFFVGAPRVVKEGSGAPVTFEVSGSGKLFYSAELRYASAQLPQKPADNGFFVQKLVRAVKPNGLREAQELLPKKSENGAPAGDLVLIDVLFESAEPQEQVVIDDPLPAGLEPIDFSLETASAATRVDDEVDGPDAKKKPALLGYGAFRSVPGLHREQHDDKVLTFLPHVEPGIYHFRYLARATTPGTYVVPPTRAEAMYSPEISGRTAATSFVVTPGAPKGPRVAKRK
ncbi:MG2 domain-containing protein [Pendulispora albinea]|uniref:MG2 domain-containing protein n=1 Tax=Pendulispora albinea TaxID=2741071 RepID=A0ABZ2LW19_9BACT